MRSTEDICPEIERNCCRIHGETFTFEVHSASIVADMPEHTALEIAVFRWTASGHVPAATVRVTAPLSELERVPTLLTRALEDWYCKTTPLARVH